MATTRPPQLSSALLDWRKHFPELARSADQQLHELLDAAPVVKLPVGQFVFHAGSLCQNYLLVLDGSVRVQVVAHSGREATLYRVGPGSSCVLTTSGLSNATAIRVPPGLIDRPAVTYAPNDRPMHRISRTRLNRDASSWCAAREYN
jgi:hypothetical protein